MNLSFASLLIQIQTSYPYSKVGHDAACQCDVACQLFTDVDRILDAHQRPSVVTDVGVGVRHVKGRGLRPATWMTAVWKDRETDCGSTVKYCSTVWTECTLAPVYDKILYL